MEEFSDLLNYDFQDLSDLIDDDPIENLAYPNIDSIAPIETYIVGDPDNTGHIAQTTAITCAVVSQQMILNDFGVVSPTTGLPLSEAELTYVAAVNGWLSEGTTPDDVGKLLDYYAIPNHKGYGIDNLVTELQQGHKVIVGVDSSELWNSNNPILNFAEDYVVGENADHAIVVNGIIFDGQCEPIVVVNDPGSPQGAGNQYPISTFLDAFQDSNCFYVATDNAPPNLAEHIQFGHHYDPLKEQYSDWSHWASSYQGEKPNHSIPTNYFNSHKPINLVDLDQDRQREILLNL